MLKLVIYKKLKIIQSLTNSVFYDYNIFMDSSKLRDIYELAELVIQEYSKSYDLDIAMMKAEVSSEEAELLKKDEEFMYRVAYEDALIRESIIETMVSNMKHDQRNSQKAAVDLGNILYKSKFNKKEEDQKGQVPDKIILSGA